MRVVVYGARADGHGKVVLEALRAEGRHEAVGFVDDTPGRAGTEVRGLKVLGAGVDLGRLRAGGVEGVALGAGDGAGRLAMAACVRAAGLALVSVVHPAAHVASSVRLGEGAVILAGAAVVAEAVLEEASLVYTCASVDHDCLVGPGASLSPGVRLAGRVRIGRAAFLGTGAVVVPDVTIGDGAFIAAGAVVVDDVPTGARVAGVPARPMRGA